MAPARGELPTAQTPNLGNLPACMRVVNQWMPWRYGYDEKGRITKVPHNPKAKYPASATEPSNWRPFAEVAALSMNKTGVGVGFALADTWIGIDLDHALDPDTGVVDPQALEIVEALDSYTEVSVSGTGLHVVTRGHKVQTWSKLNGLGDDGHLAIEVYDHARMFTCTGNVFRECGVIPDRTAEVDALMRRLQPPKAPRSGPRHDPVPVSLDDQELLEKARNSANGAKFSRLYDNGSAADYSDDASSADLALCSLLAFWTGRDRARMDRLFRSSGLYRDKWDRQDYADRTLDEAIDGCTETFKPKVHAMYGTEPQEAGLADGSDGSDGSDGHSRPCTAREGEKSTPRRTVRTVEGVLTTCVKSVDSIKTTTDDDKPRKQSDVLLDIGRTHELFHDEEGEPYAKLGPVVLNINGTRYRDRLAADFLRITRKGANRNSLADATTTLAALATFEGKQHPVWMRVGEDGDGIVIDLGDSTFRCIRVSQSGWEIVDEPPIRFRRTKRTLPLPIPTRPGNIGLLWEYLNIGPDSRPLVLAYLLAALRPVGPYPVCAFNGENGAGKTTTARMLCALVDPCGATLRSAPKDVQSLEVAALNSWLPAFDNLSYMPDLLSDAICRLSTGGALSGRTLYTNTEETCLAIKRPSIFTGIEELASRPDLAQRCLHIELHPPTIVREESALWADFNEAAPIIFAALLDGLVGALRERAAGVVIPGPLPRMADFAAWACAGLPTLGFSADEFMATYRENNEGAMVAALEGSLVGPYLLDLVRSKGRFEGSTKELHDELNACASDEDRRSRAWPRTPRGLAGAIKRLATPLRLSGVSYETYRLPDRARTRRIRLTLCNAGKRPSESSESSETRMNGRPPSDGSDDMDHKSDGSIVRNRPQSSDANPHGRPTSDGSDGSDGHSPRLHDYAGLDTEGFL